MSLDHCTSWFEGWWAACCAAHDADYAGQIGRVIADGKLLDCVAASLPAFAANTPVLTTAFGAASGIIAGAMYLAVRVFGSRFYKPGAPPPSA